MTNSTYRLKFHIMLIFCVIWTSVFGQNVINYNVDNGLPSDLVYRVSQDELGFIWILTDKGIARFNGSNFKIFTTSDGLPTNDIWDMKHTPDGKVWYFAKSASLGYIENSKVFQYKGCEGEETYYPAFLLRFGNTVIFNSNKGWHILNNGCWQKLKPLSSVNSNSLMEDYLRGFKKELRDDLLTFYSYYDQLDNKHGNDLQNLRQRVDDSLNLWLYDGGYAVENLSSKRLIKKKFINSHNPKYPYFTRSIYVNNEIQLTGFGFVTKLDENFDTVEEIVLPEEYATQFSMIDRQGNLWCASMNNGLYFIPQSERIAQYHLWDKRINQADRLGSRVFVWNNDEGYYMYNPETSEFELKFELKGLTQTATHISELSRTFFFADQQAVITDTETNVLMRTVNPGLRKLAYYNGHLYATSSGGVKKIDPETLEVSDIYPKVGVNDMLSLESNFYIGSSTGLMKFENEQFKPLYFDDKLMDKPILSLAKFNQKDLLIGTDGFGLMILRGDELRLLADTSGMRIEDISVSDGVVWLATDVGAIELILDQDLKVNRKLDRNTGLPSSKIKTVTWMDGKLLIASARAVTVVDPDEVTPPELQHLYVERIAYNDKLLDSDAVVPFAKNGALEIEVAGVNFVAKPEPLSYQYKLTPGDESWNNSSSSTINFGRLSPDEYALEIKANGLTAGYNFTIEPLWWQSTIAKVLFAAGIGLLIFLALQQYRKYDLKKKMSKLEIQNKLTEFELYALRSQMNPHFVFNSLAAIQYCINNNEVELAEKYLVKFSRLVRQFFELSKQKEVDLESEVELLRNYLDIEKLRFKEKLNYSVRVAPDLVSKNPKIPTMLLQPIVENAINHGIFNKRNGGRVDIDFSMLEDEALIVEVADDGVGMKATTKPVNGKRTSSDVLDERIGFLNKGGKWDISYKNKAAFPKQKDQGNITTFTIKEV